MKFLLLKNEMNPETMVCSLSPEIVKVDEDEDQLHRFYELIGCDAIDIVPEEIGGRPFDLIVDDEGKLKDNLPTFRLNDGRMLYGNILFAHKGEGGTTVGIEKEDIPLLTRRIWDNVKLMNAEVK